MFASIERPPPSTSCWNVSVLGVCNLGCNFCELFFTIFFARVILFLLQRRRRGGDAGGPDFVCCKLRERKKSRKDHSKGPQESC